jgi:hypothetical protein
MMSRRRKISTARDETLGRSGTRRSARGIVRIGGIETLKGGSSGPNFSNLPLAASPAPRALKLRAAVGLLLAFTAARGASQHRNNEKTRMAGSLPERRAVSRSVEGESLTQSRKKGKDAKGSNESIARSIRCATDTAREKNATGGSMPGA